MSRSTTRPIHGHRRSASATWSAVAFLVGLQGQAKAAPDILAAGKPLFDQRCGGCHEIGIGARNGEGPKLNGVIGAPAGNLPYFHYSIALRKSAVIWTEQTFKQFIADPRADIPGTIMAIPGVESPEERDVIAAYVGRFASDGRLRPLK